MELEKVANIIKAISDGFEDACLKCMVTNSDTILMSIMEQLYSGLDGEGEYLYPTYDNDPFFELPGDWYHLSKQYKAWKTMKTPPERSSMLNLPERPEEVPNLYINGRFYRDLTIVYIDDGVIIDPGKNHGPDIVKKYGDQILDMGPTAIEYFNETYMMPAIDEFFNDCGYK